MTACELTEPVAVNGDRPIDICKRLCRYPNVILDCGAGRGHFAALFRLFYPYAKVLCCEPTSASYKTLLEVTGRLTDNEAGGAWTKCRQIAVSDFSGRAEMNLTANDESSSLLESPSELSPLWKYHRTVATESVDVKTIDAWLAEESIDPSQVSILKLDVQGAELRALRGAENLLQTVEIVIAEVWHEPGYGECPTMEEVTSYLTARGFECVAICQHATGMWSDAVYRRKEGSAVRLNIGAGSTVIPGFTAIDKKLGSEAYPLKYADASVDEIRCSHMLEHLSFEEVQQALKEWNRVLKPGGKLRISVPDVRKVMDSMEHDENWRFKLMGGQTDGNDFHKSAFDEGLLRAHFDKFGFENIQPWESPNTDTAADPISLNLEGFKKSTSSDVLKIRAVMSIPRVGWNDAWVSINAALSPLKIPVETFNGVFWGQCMQRAFQNALVDGIDWLLCLDYDSMITSQHVNDLLAIFAEHPEIDALASLQARRGNEEAPLVTVKGQTSMQVTGEPIQVSTAHFGLTLIRTECLRDMAKPWFKSEPDPRGEWGDGRLDDDIWFWHQWRNAGKTVYVAPDVRVGHLQLMVSEFDEDFKCKHVHVQDWRKKQGLK